jgi:hypothetical protein
MTVVSPTCPGLWLGKQGHCGYGARGSWPTTLFSLLFALHCDIFALLVPWHVGEGAAAYLGNVIRVVCCDDESILYYNPVALCLVGVVRRLFQCVLLLSRVATC